MLVAGLAIAARPAHAGTLETIELPDRNGELPAEWLYHPGEPRANILLPDGYRPNRAYPLLLLLGGFTNDYASWVEVGHADKTLSDLNAIVVMPEAGGGWYADWWNEGARADPAWESYYLDEVLPQVRKRYRIRPGRRYHSVVGVSMGGLGAAYLGGRLPGYFGSVGIISGFLDMQYLPGVAAAQSILAGGADGESLYGPAGSFYEDGHNPTRLVENLGKSRVYVGVGDGTISSRGYGSGDAAEAAQNGDKERLILRPMTDDWIGAARAAGVSVDYHPHPGIHDWPDFNHDLAGMLRWGLFEPVARHARRWVNRTVATHGRLWQFNYRFHRPPDSVVRFRRKGKRLHISDAGSRVTLGSNGCRVRVETPASVRLPLCSRRGPGR